MGVEGGNKKENQAGEMVKDLAKFLKFASPTALDFDLVCNRQMVLEYVHLLRKLGVGPSGQVNKIQTIVVAITWLISKLPDASPTSAEKDKLHVATVCRDKLQAIKKSIGQEKVCMAL